MNLSVKVGSAVLVVLTVALAVSGWVSVQKEREILNNLLQKHGQSFSNTIAVACIEALISEDYPILDTFLETTGRDRDDILSIEVLQHGKVVSKYAANDEERGDRVLFNSDVQFTMEADQSLIKLGEIRLELSNRQNRQIVADRIQSLIMKTVLIFVLLSGTLMLVFRKLVIDKIKHLNDHSKRVGAGNFDLKIDLRTRDELGHLANTFNDMVGTIKHYHEHLEALVKDRTAEIEQMHGQLVMQEKMASIGQLAAGIAHELNNPINFVRTNFASLAENFTDLTEILNDYHKFVEGYEAQNNSLSELTSVRAKETTLQIDYILNDIPALFEESERGFGRIAQIVQSMRNFSRADQNGEYHYFNINKGIEDTLVITKNVYNHHAEVKTAFAALPEIRCLPDQLNQVFLNLIVNSAQAIEAKQMATKGVIAIRTWQEENYVCCEIADNGSGIPEKIRSRIFEPFFTTKEPGQGTGLGLSISYDIIVHKHKGKLSVDCPETGGSVFILRIPMNLQPTQNSQKGTSQPREE